MYNFYWNVYINGVFFGVVGASSKSQAIAMVAEDQKVSWASVTASEYTGK